MIFFSKNKLHIVTGSGHVLPSNVEIWGWKYLFNIVACLGTGLDEHNIEFLGFTLAILAGHLSFVT